MIPMTNRIDSWSHREDAILVESILENARENRAKMDAYSIASGNLKKYGFNRTSAACVNRYFQIKDKVIKNPSLELEEVVKLPDPPESGPKDYIDTLISNSHQKEDKQLVGLYFDADIASALDWCGKKGGRGAKSRIANDALRKFFEEKGLL